MRVFWQQILRVGERNSELMFEEKFEPALCVCAETSMIGGDAKFVRRFERFEFARVVELSSAFSPRALSLRCSLNPRKL